MFVGLGFMLCLVPVNGIVFTKIGRIRGQIAGLADTRVKITNEVLSTHPLCVTLHRIFPASCLGRTPCLFPTLLSFSSC
jgi:hypothetical protein